MNNLSQAGKEPAMIYKASQAGKEPAIIYKDSGILVCHKPAGIAVENAKTGEMDLYSLLMNQNMKAAPSSSDRHKNREPKAMAAQELYIVHRLDQPVEGIVVFGLTRKAAAGLGKMLQTGGMEKIYYAVTEGEPAQESAELCDYLKKDARANISSVVPGDTPGAKKAVLHYQVLEKKTTGEGTILSLVKIKLETGRHHQIRVQMAHAGMPLLGDRKYGNKSTELRFPALCAAELGFVHPITGKRKHFKITPRSEAFSLFDYFGQV